MILRVIAIIESLSFLICVALKSVPKALLSLTSSNRIEQIRASITERFLSALIRTKSKTKALGTYWKI